MGTHKLLRITDIDHQRVNWDNVPYTNVEDSEFEKYRIRDGDILFARIGATVGKTYLASDVPDNAVYASYLIRVQTLICDPRYLIAYFDSPFYWSQIGLNAVGSGRPNVNGTVLSGLFVPIPPLAEQRRIVEALDRYLALVDEIEQAQADVEELFAQLKSKVLDLAIRGELTEQDPSDEPASTLLERIHEEKLAMVERGELKAKDVKNDTVIFTGSDGLRYEKQADGSGEARCIEEDLPFELPEAWAWSRLGTISNYGNAPSLPVDQIEDDAWILDLEDIEKGTGKILQKVNKTSRPSSSAKRPFRKDQLLYSKLRPYLNKVLIADEDGFCTSEILPISLYGGIDPSYLRHCLMSNYFLAYADLCVYGCKMPRLGTGDGQKALIPVPPLNEQSRIDEVIESVLNRITS